MIKNLFAAISSIFLLASCSSLKSLHVFANKSQDPATSKEVANTPPPAKFLDISVKPESIANSANASEAKTIIADETKEKEVPVIADYFNRNAEIPAPSSLQLKYAYLLKTDCSQLQNNSLFENIDDWYGTRYRMGGTTKKGVDCSAFVGAIFVAVYGVTLPRVAREQYRYCHKISRTDLQEGDLLFFNTRGGVSHVGIYLQNNKFVHASTSKGVTISDMYETYYLKRFIGAGRIENKQSTAAVSVY